MPMSGVSRIGNDQYTYETNRKNPADIAIQAGITSQTRGYKAGVDNASAGNQYLNVAEGGLSSIQDSLQRIRELSVRAKNDLLTIDDKSAIQTEVDGLLKTIQDAAKGTQYNTLKPLDGSMADVNLATNPSGGGMEIKLGSSTLESLGISDYSVLDKNFDISKIDKALKQVTETRSDIGAYQSSLDSQINIGNITSENTQKSAIDGLSEMIEKVSQRDKDRVMEEYNNFATMSKIKQQKADIEVMLGIR